MRSVLCLIASATYSCSTVHVSQPAKPPRPAVLPVQPPAAWKNLAERYPPEALAMQQAGWARLKLRVQKTGRIQVLGVTSASAAEFGLACSRALGGTVWTPARDAAGHAMAFDIDYKCEFTLTP